MYTHDARISREGVENRLPLKFLTLQFASLSKATPKNVQRRAKGERLNPAPLKSKGMVSFKAKNNTMSCFAINTNKMRSKNYDYPHRQSAPQASLRHVFVFWTTYCCKPGIPI